jgi:outer membrane murein-binding lipoprotein Lpp
VPAALVTAVIMIAGWLPFSSLWHQQAQIDTTASQIKALQQQEASLKSQAKTIDTKAAATALAREQYQLVNPGQSLIQVLPGDSSGQVSASSADPGLQPLVAPSSVATPLVTATTVTHHTNQYVSRLLRTLEFWR